MTRRASTDAPVTIRLGVPEERQALLTLALLDSARPLSWRVLVPRAPWQRAAPAGLRLQG